LQNGAGECGADVLKVKRERVRGKRTAAELIHDPVAAIAAIAAATAVAESESAHSKCFASAALAVAAAAAVVVVFYIAKHSCCSEWRREWVCFAPTVSAE